MHHTNPCPACRAGIKPTPTSYLSYFNEDKDNAVETLVLTGIAIKWWKMQWEAAEEIYPFKRLALFRKGNTFRIRPTN